MIVDELQELGAELHLVNKGQVDLNDNTAVLMLSIEGHLSHNEVDIIVERMAIGRREKTKQGKVMIAIPPYGYDIDLTTETTKNGRIIVNDRQLIPNPVESHLVKMIYDLYASGDYSYYGLAQHLNKQGYRYRNNTEFNHVYVRRVLNHRAYIGEYTYSGITLNVPQIVDLETWQAAQDIIARNKECKRRKPKNKYLFAQRVTCFHCDNAMSGTSKDHYLYYRCGAANRSLRHVYGELCHNKKLFPETRLQTAVFDWLQEVLTNKKILRKGWNDYVAEQMKSHQPLLDELERVKKIIDSSQRKLNKLLDAYLDEVIDKETLQHRKSHLEQEIKSAKMTKADLEDKLADIAKLPQQLKTIEELELKSETAFKYGIPDKYKPGLIKELNVKVKLEFIDNEMFAGITCIVGKTEKHIRLIGTSFI